MLCRVAPARGHAPSVVLTEARADDEDDVGFTAGHHSAVVGVEEVRVVLGDDAAGGNARTHGRRQKFAERYDLFARIGPVRALACVDIWALGVGEQLGCARDPVRISCAHVSDSVALGG